MAQEVKVLSDLRYSLPGGSDLILPFFCFPAAAAAATATTSSSIPDVSVSAGTSDAGYDEISQDYYLYDNYARPE